MKIVLSVIAIVIVMIVLGIMITNKIHDLHFEIQVNNIASETGHTVNDVKYIFSIVHDLNLTRHYLYLVDVSGLSIDDFYNKYIKGDCHE